MSTKDFKVYPFPVTQREGRFYPQVDETELNSLDKEVQKSVQKAIQHGFSPQNSPKRNFFSHALSSTQYLLPSAISGPVAVALEVLVGEGSTETETQEVYLNQASYQKHLADMEPLIRVKTSRCTTTQAEAKVFPYQIIKFKMDGYRCVPVNPSLDSSRAPNKKGFAIVDNYLTRSVLRAADKASGQDGLTVKVKVPTETGFLTVRARPTSYDKFLNRIGDDPVLNELIIESQESVELSEEKESLQRDRLADLDKLLTQKSSPYEGYKVPYSLQSIKTKYSELSGKFKQDHPRPIIESSSDEELDVSEEDDAVQIQYVRGEVKSFALDAQTGLPLSKATCIRQLVVLHQRLQKALRPPTIEPFKASEIKEQIELLNNHLQALEADPTLTFPPLLPSGFERDSIEHNLYEQIQLLRTLQTYQDPPERLLETTPFIAAHLIPLYRAYDNVQLEILKQSIELQESQLKSLAQSHEAAAAIFVPTEDQITKKAELEEQLKKIRLDIKNVLIGHFSKTAIALLEQSENQEDEETANVIRMIPAFLSKEGKLLSQEAAIDKAGKKISSFKATMDVKEPTPRFRRRPSLRKKEAPKPELTLPKEEQSATQAFLTAATQNYGQIQNLYEVFTTDYGVYFDRYQGEEIFLDRLKSAITKTTLELIRDTSNLAIADETFKPFIKEQVRALRLEDLVEERTRKAKKIQRIDQQLQSDQEALELAGERVLLQTALTRLNTKVAEKIDPILANYQDSRESSPDADELSDTEAAEASGTS